MLQIDTGDGQKQKKGWFKTSGQLNILFCYVNQQDVM